MAIATAQSWKTLPPPVLKIPLGYEATYTEAEAQRMKNGFIPAGMDDRWFIYFADDWLYFHRSWTGYCLFGLRLADSLSGVRVVDSWVNRDPEQYTNEDIGYDREQVKSLVEEILLAE